MANERARGLRKRMTDHEKFFWRKVRNRAFEDYKFRRQVPIGPYVADFACMERRLVVELDGSGHLLTVEEDARRTEYLKRDGWRVLRFWNHDVTKEWTLVAEEIWTALQQQPYPSPPTPLPQGERGEEGKPLPPRERRNDGLPR